MFELYLSFIYVSVLFSSAHDWSRNDSSTRFTWTHTFRAKKPGTTYRADYQLCVQLVLGLISWRICLSHLFHQKSLKHDCKSVVCGQHHLFLVKYNILNETVKTSVSTGAFFYSCLFHNKRVTWLAWYLFSVFCWYYLLNQVYVRIRDRWACRAAAVLRGCYWDAVLQKYIRVKLVIYSRSNLFFQSYSE